MTSNPAISRPIVLCVDDEPNVLGALTLTLGRNFTVEVAASGAAGLQLLRDRPSVAVVVSDMRMPGMDGATFLSQVRANYPDVVRVMLTGQGDVGVAVAAINQGEIFRLLSKPCPAPLLVSTVRAAVEQHRLITSERVLLQDTLHGSIKAMTEVLALANPAAFGRSMRVKRLVGELAARLRLRRRWQAEIAAMLSHLGFVTLSDATVQKLHFGQPLDADEQRSVHHVPELTDRLLAHIPRLEGVRDTIALAGQMARGAVTQPERGFDDQVLMGAHMLRAAIDWDILDAQGVAPVEALRRLAESPERYTDEVLEALAALRGPDAAIDPAVGAEDPEALVAEVALANLKVGVLLAQDLHSTSGQLLAVRGQEVSESFLGKLANADTKTLPAKVTVVTATLSNKPHREKVLSVTLA